ncbi:MAG TPA: hypothetical protein VK145_01855, partial [Candidatus Nanoarchaeia archaeon]|nr:hypothetical protein [Candidatus Nanoarchaeia archaeon]
MCSPTASTPALLTLLATLDPGFPSIKIRLTPVERFGGSLQILLLTLNGSFPLTDLAFPHIQTTRPIIES